MTAGATCSDSSGGVNLMTCLPSTHFPQFSTTWFEAPGATEHLRYWDADRNLDSRAPGSNWVQLRPLLKDTCVTELYLLRPLEADPALRWSSPALWQTREGSCVQASVLVVFGSILIVLKGQAAWPRVRAVIFLLIVPVGAAERRPPTAPHGEPSHPGLGVRVCACVRPPAAAGSGAHQEQHFEFIEKHPDPILKHSSAALLHRHKQK